MKIFKIIAVKIFFKKNKTKHMGSLTCLPSKVRKKKKNRAVAKDITALDKRSQMATQLKDNHSVC